MFKGKWSEREKEIWRNTNWLARDYKDLIVEDDIIEGIATFYDIGKKVEVKAKFVKAIRANPIYPPYYKLYTIIDNTIIDNDIKYTRLMYDGHDIDGYQIHDRFESAELYERLSR